MCVSQMLQRFCNGFIANHVQLHIYAVLWTPDQKHDLRALILNPELDLIGRRVPQLPRRAGIPRWGPPSAASHTWRPGCGTGVRRHLSGLRKGNWMIWQKCIHWWDLKSFQFPYQSCISTDLVLGTHILLPQPYSTLLTHLCSSKISCIE